MPIYWVDILLKGGCHIREESRWWNNCNNGWTIKKSFIADDRGSVVAERLRAPNSNSGVSDQQSVGSSPSHDTCVLKQGT